MKCDYCNERDGIFQQSNNKICCQKHYNSCPKIKAKNSQGLKNAYSTGTRNAKEIYNNAKDESKEKMNWSKGLNTGTHFVYNGKGNHKDALIKERGHKCESCRLETWMSEPITLELDHIDGDNKNNVKENLRLLCCNCHSLTPTWRGRNNNGRKKVSDETLIQAMIKYPNIHQALDAVGLCSKGGNYTRAKKLWEKYIKTDTINFIT